MTTALIDDALLDANHITDEQLQQQRNHQDLIRHCIDPEYCNDGLYRPRRLSRVFSNSRDKKSTMWTKLPWIIGIPVAIVVLSFGVCICIKQWEQTKRAIQDNQQLQKTTKELDGTRKKLLQLENRYSSVKKQYEALRNDFEEITSLLEQPEALHPQSPSSTKNQAR
jgi:hypothetical protein